MTTRVGLVQLGCAKNQVDGEEMLGALAGAGDVVFVADKRDADVLIVNTCGFIQSAKEESIDAILKAVELKKRGRVSRVIVTGCLAQRYGEELARDIPEVDAFFGIESAPQIGNVVFGAAPKRRNLVEPVADRYPLVPPARLRASATPWTAYLKLSEGCDHTCTFCAIPGIRGKHRSKPMERLVQEATDLAAGGAVELNLVAQDTTAYGMDLYDRLALPDLLQKLSDIPGVKWIRLLYCYPTMVRPPLIEAIAGLPNVIPYIDMPLQHGDDEMLSRMKRGGSVVQYRRLFDRMRASIPGLVLRTTFLVGFPGETDTHVENLLQFVRDVQFDRVGVFTYSAEENTPAFALPNAVPPSVMRRRRDAVMTLQQEISRERNRAWIGKELDVLLEEKQDDCWTGRSYRDAPEIDGTVKVVWNKSVPDGGNAPRISPPKGTPAAASSVEPRLGGVVHVRVVSALDYDLGAVVEAPEQKAAS